MLVSLAVLGLIAGLTVPSVINSVTSNKQRAVLKETYQVVQEALYSITIDDGVYTNTAQLLSKLGEKLNAKMCNASKGVWSQSSSGDLCVKGTGPSYPYQLASGLLLPTGAFVTIPSAQMRWADVPNSSGIYGPSPSYYFYHIIIDTNVKSSGKVRDVDVISFMFNPNEFTVFYHGFSPKRRATAYMLVPDSDTAMTTWQSSI